MGYKIPRESWRIIEVVIRRYPENKAAYDNAIEELLHSPSDQDGQPKGNSISNPTERVAMKIVSDSKLARIKREIDAVDAVYSNLRPEYQKIIRVRFWSYRHQNMSYFKMEPCTSYRERQMQKVVGCFIREVGKKLGEI